jgi:hypothetical protein
MEFRAFFAAAFIDTFLVVRSDCGVEDFESGTGDITTGGDEIGVTTSEDDGPDKESGITSAGAEVVDAFFAKKRLNPDGFGRSCLTSSFSAETPLCSNAFGLGTVFSTSTDCTLDLVVA